MKTSCISHPPLNSCLKIYAWQVQACDGDVSAAALLSHFEWLQNNKYGIDKHSQHLNDIAERHHKPRTFDEDTLIPVKLPDLRSALLGLCAEKKISECLNLLFSKGFISIDKNPDPEKILDRTKYVRFNPEVCNKWIQDNYDNAGSLVSQSNEITFDSAKRESRFSQKAESITPKGSLDYAKRQNREM